MPNIPHKLKKKKNGDNFICYLHEKNYTFQVEKHFKNTSTQIIIKF